MAREDVGVYFEKFAPTVLRWNKQTGTLGLRAINMKASKGYAYDRVLIFPPKTMIKFIAADGQIPLKAAREALYVAVTRARYSLAFVVDRKCATYMP